MKTEKEITARLDEIERDERLTKYSAATVFANAPLALIQLSLYAEANALRFALNLPARKYYGKD